MSDTHIHIHLGAGAPGEAPKVVSKQSPSKPRTSTSAQGKKKRKPSAYSKKYGAAFKKVAKKHKTKSGSWKKGGFKRAQKEAHKLAKKK